MKRKWLTFLSIGLLLALSAAVGVAQDPAAVPEAVAATTDAAAAAIPAAPDMAKTLEEINKKTGDMKVALDTVWVLVTAMLVFFMNLGFACVESGMCRAKNCVNILSKNFVVFAVTSVFFWILGFGLMFGSGSLNDYVGTDGLLMVKGADNSPATLTAYSGVYGSLNWTGVPLWAKFFFQLVFAGTAATIVSGAVAERIKYHSFIIFSALMAVVIYPVVGHWIWGGGWLASKGFLDFAGSTQVHSIGGWAALMGVLILGPRIGKYGPDGKVNAIPGHNLSSATIGCLILWLGWFGFNPGSTMAADPGFIADVCNTTNIAAAVATLTATITCWVKLGKPDLGMTLNGCLAGLVAVTAPCAWISVESAAIIGAISGVAVVLAVITFDKFGIDDPVGATSVHLVNGVFGTICVGLFSEPAIMASRGLDPKVYKGGLFFGGGMDQLIAQLTGVVATAVYVVIVSGICWMVLKSTIGIRVSPEEEMEGLDIGEHGNEAYHGFVQERT
jgi:Amt family ammonium transporter